MEDFLKVIGLIILILVIIPLLLVLPTMWLWNWLMPELFDLTTITFWQALGINILSSLLFKNTSSNSND